MTRTSRSTRRAAVTTGAAALGLTGALLFAPAATAAPAAEHVGQPASSTATTSHADGQHYAAAKQAWIEGDQAVNAELDTYRDRAARALAVAPGNQYFTQVHQLIELTTYPNTDLTPAQIQRIQQLTQSLNAFFGTPGLYQ